MQEMLLASTALYKSRMDTEKELLIFSLCFVFVSKLFSFQSYQEKDRKIEA